MTVTAAMLETYLGATVDETRASLLITQASNLVDVYFSPEDAPDAADAVVLSAASRAYVNPSGVTSEMTGPYQVTRPSAGVYLTKAERTTLRRLATGGGAFSIDLIPGYPDSRFPQDATP